MHICIYLYLYICICIGMSTCVSYFFIAVCSVQLSAHNFNFSSEFRKFHREGNSKSARVSTCSKFAANWHQTTRAEFSKVVELCERNENCSQNLLLLLKCRAHSAPLTSFRPHSSYISPVGFACCDLTSSFVFVATPIAFVRALFVLC